MVRRMAGKGLIAPGAGLTEQQRKFVMAYINSGDEKAAAIASEYSWPMSPTARQAIRSPVVVAAIQAEVSRRIRTEGAVIGHSVLIEVARDTTAPKGVRVDAAKALLDRAGHIAPRAEAARNTDGRPLAEYSIEDLQGLVDSLKRRAADQARDVTAPISASASSDLAEMLD